MIKQIGLVGMIAGGASVFSSIFVSTYFYPIPEEYAKIRETISDLRTENQTYSRILNICETIPCSDVIIYDIEKAMTENDERLAPLELISDSIKERDTSWINLATCMNFGGLGLLVFSSLPVMGIIPRKKKIKSS